jgi:hypothetical protein
MRVVHVYLAVYFLLLAGAVATLWRAGVLARLPAGGVVLTVGVSLALGVLLAIVSRRPRIGP